MYWDLSFRGTVGIIGLILIVGIVGLLAKEKMKGDSFAANLIAWGYAALGIGAMIWITLIK